MRFALCGAMLAATFIGGVTFMTTAQASGLTFLHKIEQVGSDRQCMVEHTHHGDSRPNSSKEAAAVEAARAWSGFTALEYGSEWANIKLSIDQGLDCRPVDVRHGHAWQCKVTAKPCRAAHPGSPAPVHAAPVKAAPSPSPSKDVVHAAAPAPAQASYPVAMKMRVKRDARSTVEHVHTPYCAHRHGQVRAFYHGTDRSKLVWPGDRR